MKRQIGFTEFELMAHLKVVTNTMLVTILVICTLIKMFVFTGFELMTLLKVVTNKILVTFVSHI